VRSSLTSIADRAHWHPHEHHTPTLIAHVGPAPAVRLRLDEGSSTNDRL
jgi:hypothetical protein